METGSGSAFYPLEMFLNVARPRCNLVLLVSCVYVALTAVGFVARPDCSVTQNVCRCTDVGVNSLG